MKIEIIIPIAKSDVEALKNSLPYILEQLPNYRIIIIADEEVRQDFSEFTQVEFIDENQMLPGLNYDSVNEIINDRYPKASRRTGWYFQQFLKLGYARICKSEYYLSWDSDTIPLKGVTFTDDQGRPYLDTVPWVVEDKAYTDTIDLLWSDGSVKNLIHKSFITEHMLFRTQIVKQMLNEIETNQKIIGESFFEKILYTIPQRQLNLSGFSEFETYAAYVQSRHSDVYHLREWKNLRNGKIFFGSKPTNNQLTWASDLFDVVSIEDFDHQWEICKLICNGIFTRIIRFETIYNILNPMIRFNYKIRMLVRRIVRA